jgi:hypothetical protein
MSIIAERREAQKPLPAVPGRKVRVRKIPAARDMTFDEKFFAVGREKDSGFL